MSQRAETVGIKPRSATQIQNLRGAFLENFVLNLIHLLVDDALSAAGEIMRLAKVFGQHPAAEIWIMPRDFLPVVDIQAAVYQGCEHVNSFVPARHLLADNDLPTSHHPPQFKLIIEALELGFKEFRVKRTAVE